MKFNFLQCSNEECRFRFPVVAAETKALLCPRCRGPLDVTATTSHTKPEPPTLPHDSPRVVGLLDNIRSIHNVGSMFRSADGAGVSHLYLAGMTATPEHPKLAKAALGAHQTVQWSYFTNGPEAAATLRADGYRLWALERLHNHEPSLTTEWDYLPDNVALVVGNELAGVDPAILAQCEAIISLPMLGLKSSLNAAVAFGIAIYYLRFGRALLHFQPVKANR